MLKRIIGIFACFSFAIFVNLPVCYAIETNESESTTIEIPVINADSQDNLSRGVGSTYFVLVRNAQDSERCQLDISWMGTTRIASVKWESLKIRKSVTGTIYETITSGIRHTGTPSPVGSVYVDTFNIPLGVTKAVIQPRGFFLYDLDATEWIPGLYSPTGFYVDILPEAPERIIYEKRCA